MKSRNLIRDGQDRLGYIKPAAGLHEGLSFRFRMLLPEQCEELDGIIAKMPATAYVEECARSMASAVVYWSEVDDNGKMVPITAQWIKRLPPPLFTRLLNICQGRNPIDLPPDDSPERDEAARLMGTAARNDESIGQTTLRESEGN